MKRENEKVNAKLLKLKMEDKFKTAFVAVNVGVTVLAVLALLNIMI